MAMTRGACALTLFLASPLVGADASPAADMRDAVVAAVTRLQAPAPKMLSYGGTVPTPGTSTPPQPFALTGAEDVTRESYLEATRTGHLADAFPDLYEALRIIEAASVELGRTTTFAEARETLRWLELRRDWARAVALGHASAAAEIAEATRDAVQWIGVGGDSRDGSYYPWWPPEMIRLVATSQKIVLEAAASALWMEAAYLSDALDPEGYLRQSLNHAAHQAEMTAGALVDLGEISAIAEDLRFGF